MANNNFLSILQFIRDEKEETENNMKPTKNPSKQYAAEKSPAKPGLETSMKSVSLELNGNKRLVTYYLTPSRAAFHRFNSLPATFTEASMPNFSFNISATCF